ncbi:MAG: Ig-like domain-containing protein, partial [Verrucomicrobiota bacterium]|nr:Ig-like domain-containing protein [Verrucomicrobiota bacterium]
MASLSAPIPGDRIDLPWPPPEREDFEGVDDPGLEPLVVLRHAPDGEILKARGITVTFSEPMVPLSSVEDAAKERHGVVMEPEVAGSWRWLDVRTLVFEPPSRLPMATRYTVTVPLGTEAMNGARLALPHTFHFSTPAPRLIRQIPSGKNPVSRQPLIFLAFDQEVEKDEVAARLRLREIRPLMVDRNIEFESLDPSRPTGDEALDEELAQRVEEAGPGRWAAFRSMVPLQMGVTGQLELLAGMPSREGPEKTHGSITWNFQTYQPLKVTGSDCGRHGDSPEACQPR